MTNKEWLATLSAEDWYKEVHCLIFDYGMQYTDTRLAVIAWLDEEHTSQNDRSSFYIVMSEQSNLCETCLWWDGINNRCSSDHSKEGHCWTNPFDSDEKSIIFDKRRGNNGIE